MPFCRPSWFLALVMGVITVGLVMLVEGETRFDMTGFVLVMVAACLAGLRWALTQLLLQGTDAHGSHAGALRSLTWCVICLTILHSPLIGEVRPRSLDCKSIDYIAAKPQDPVYLCSAAW